MDHGGHGGHGGHDMPPMGPTCSMNMLWNTQIIDTCIVFPSWHIGSTSSFVFSCIAIVALGVFYEYLRALQKSFDQRLALSLSKGKNSQGRNRSRSPSPVEVEQQGLLTGHSVLRPPTGGVRVPLVPRIIRAVFYGATVFLSFFLMLVFMTYNAYLILAVVLSAGIGHFIFGSTIDLDDKGGKGMACH